MEILYEKYTNIQKFIKEYRKYEINEKFHDFESFKKNMQIEQYIKHNCIDTIKGRKIHIFIFMDQSKYIKTTIQFKRLIDKIPEELSDIIIISKDELSIYISKALMKYNNFRFYNYPHKLFAIELALGPMCSKHTLLSNNEVRTLCARDLIIHPLSLPSISVNDPQNIWIGGELGQVIKIESISEITGKSIRYRIISPDSGKIINTQKIKNDVDDDEKSTVAKNIDETKTDEVSEYVDNIEDEEEENAE